MVEAVDMQQEQHQQSATLLYRLYNPQVQYPSLITQSRISAPQRSRNDGRRALDVYAYNCV